MEQTLIERLRKRAEIRRSIHRGEHGRIADILEEAADEIERLNEKITGLYEDLASNYI